MFAAAHSAMLAVRQWLLSAPKRLRYFLHVDADLQGAVLRLYLAKVERRQRAHGAKCSAETRIGAVAFIHRFGSSLNEHVHFHCCAIGGVFAPTAETETDDVAVGLDEDAITAVQAQVRRRVLRTFVRCGLIEKDDADAMAG